MKQAAQYGFHSHSDFSNVRADFMFTGLKNNYIVMKQDAGTELSPVFSDEHAQGSLQSKGTVKGGVKPGQCGGVKVGQSIVGGCCEIAG